MRNTESFEIVIIGGSYAGLSAAMALGRSLRRVLVIDSGNPCNKQTPHSHNLITHDGEKPAVIAEKAKWQVLQYPTVRFLNGKVIKAGKKENAFEIETERGEVIKTKKLIFTTGLTDTMPDIKGFSECWGISILHCPYCHGYEYKKEKTAILANGDLAYESVKMISHWTKDLVVFTNGKSTLSSEQTDKVLKNNVRIIEDEIDSFEHNQGLIQCVVFKDGSKQQIKALYARPKYSQQTELPQHLGCEITEQGLIKVDIFQKTTVYGVYAAGDNSNWGRAVSLSISSGSVAGMMANKELIEEDF